MHPWRGLAEFLSTTRCHVKMESASYDSGETYNNSIKRSFMNIQSTELTAERQCILLSMLVRFQPNA
jgi:hypothetical protein